MRDVKGQRRQEKRNDKSQTTVSGAAERGVGRKAGISTKTVISTTAVII